MFLVLSTLEYQGWAMGDGTLTTTVRLYEYIPFSEYGPEEDV